MVEDARPVDASTVELTREAAPGEHVTHRGEDVAAGAVLLPRGRRLRAQDIGLLAALGLTDVAVHRRPRVAVLSTGDEIVPVDQPPGPGQVRDVNTYTLTALATRCGAEPVRLGLIGDDPAALRQAVARGIETADVVLVSGGTSVGRRDFTLQTLLSFPGAELLVHGVSISPGKVAILVRLGQRALWGLPGRISGGMVVFDLFIRPLLRRLSGETSPDDRACPALKARLGRDLASVPGRERIFQVRLERTDGGLLAWPIQRVSGPLTSLVEADGLIRVPPGEGGLDRDDEVEVHLFG